MGVPVSQKDVKAIIDVGKKNNLEMNLCSAVDKVNISQRFNFFNKIKTFLELLKVKLVQYGDYLSNLTRMI